MNKRTIIIKNDNNVDQKLYFPVRSLPCRAKLIPNENAYNVINAYCGNPICHLLHSYMILYSMESPPSLDCYRFFLISGFLCNLHSISQTSHVGVDLYLCSFRKISVTFFVKKVIALFYHFFIFCQRLISSFLFLFVVFETIICAVRTSVNTFLLFLALFVDFSTF